MALPFAEGFAAGAHFSLRVFNEATAQNLHTLIEIFDSEHHTGTARQGFDLCATILQLGNKALDFRKLGDHIEMRVGVHSGIKGGGKLLEGMNVMFNGRSRQSETLG